MTVDKYLDKIDDLLEEAWNLPLMGTKRMVDVNKIRDLIDEIRMNLPQEVKDAKAIVADREQIIRDARSEAEDITRRAETKARRLVAKEDILKEAQSKAAELLNDARSKAREIERASLDFSENTLKKSEDALLLALNGIKSTRLAFRQKSRSTGGAVKVKDEKQS